MGAKKKAVARVAKKTATPAKKTATPAKKTATPGKKTVAKAIDPAKQLDALRSYIRSTGVKFLDDPNISSIGIGLKDGQHVLQFTVDKKVAPDNLEALETLGTELIPESIEVDGMTIPTDVLQRSFKASYELVQPEAKSDRKLRANPIAPGMSVSHPTGSAGTLGAVVFDTRSGDACILSNWHVLHTAKGNLGDRVVQPGPYDDNRVAQNYCGTLLRSHLGAAGDCAIAKIENRRSDPKGLELTQAPKRLGRAEINDLVIKSGRTTGVTVGVVRRVDVMVKLTYDGVGPTQIGGFEIGRLPDQSTSYQVSSPGDSGSVWLAAEKKGAEVVATDVMLGLHFAGESGGSDDEHAIACYASSVFEKLEIAFDAPVAQVLEAKAEAYAPAGYVSDFLGSDVAPPSVARAKARDVVPFNGGDLIPYTHFSVCLSKSRRFAHFVAWNIDGDQLKTRARTNLRFKKDPRVDADYQVGDELYSNNKLDRGHIARRVDVIWGSAKEAQQGNVDSFYFTNMTPQHEGFNQSKRSGLWGELENAIYEEVDVLKQRLAIFGGPIFQDDDPPYRGVQIPRDFFKVVVYVDAADDVLKAKAYKLTQNNLLDDIEAFDLDPFRMYQLSLAELEDTTGLSFGALKKADTHEAAVGPEAIGGRAPAREIRSRAEIVQ